MERVTSSTKQVWSGLLSPRPRPSFDKGMLYLRTRYTPCPDLPKQPSHTMLTHYCPDSSVTCPVLSTASCCSRVRPVSRINPCCIRPLFAFGSNAFSCASFPLSCAHLSTVLTTSANTAWQCVHTGQCTNTTTTCIIPTNPAHNPVRYSAASAVHSTYIQRCLCCPQHLHWALDVKPPVSHTDPGAVATSH
jgi:hypothetical protein